MAYGQRYVLRGMRSMFTQDVEVKEICGRRLRVVERGLDEAEVTAVIGSLVERNGELESRQEHLQSFTKQIEKVIQKAHDEASGVKAEVEKKARVKAATIVTRAEQEASAKAEKITAEARGRAKAEAEAIEAEARRRAEEAARENVAQAEKQAQEIVRAAEEKAKAIEASSAERAAATAAQAKQMAETEAALAAKEAEVAALTSKLQDQMEDLAGKQEYVLSLTKVLEKAVGKAQEEADGVRAEAERKVKARVMELTARAEEEARVKAEATINEAREKARAEAGEIRTEAERKAEEAARQKLTWAEERAVGMAKAAEEKAEATRKLAEEEVARITADARERAEQEASQTRDEARRLLLESRKIAESEIGELKGRFLKACEGVFSEAATYPRERQSDNAEMQVQTIVEPVQAGPVSLESPAEPPEAPKGDGKASATFHGDVELVVMPPVSLERLLDLYRHLRSTPEIKVLYMKGAPNNAVNIRMYIPDPLPLINVLEALPEVESVSDRRKVIDRLFPARRKGSDQSVRTVVVTTAS
jgi:F0F1-type ATP synthase membrane subunit b/b'